MIGRKLFVERGNPTKSVKHLNAHVFKVFRVHRTFPQFLRGPHGKDIRSRESARCFAARVRRAGGEGRRVLGKLADMPFLKGGCQ